jgi:glucans biosynthesis protein C
MSLRQRSVLPERLACLDNLRYLVVLAVIAFHSTSAYVGATYFVMDPRADWLTRWLNGFLLSFAMTVLFFVAGYFALPSLEQKGVARFVANKLTRLGIPFLLGVAFLAPISTYIAYAAQGYRGLASPGYWEFWKMYMRTIPDFPAAHLGGDAFSANPQFHYHHFWFIALLIGLCVAFALLWGLKQRLFGARLALAGSPAPSNAAISLAVLVFGGVSALAGNAGQWLAGVPGVDPVLAVLGTSPWQLPSMALYFAMGIYAYRKRWFVNGTYPGHLLGWILAWLALLFSDQLGLRLWWQPLRDVLYIALLSGLAFKFLNRRSRFHESLAANSYSMFVVHFPIVVLLQFLLLPLPLPAWAKFSFCATAAIGASWSISNYLIRPFPRAAAAGLVALFAAMCLGLHPEASAEAAQPAGEAEQPRRFAPDYGEIAGARLRWYDEQIGLTDEQKTALRPLLEAQARTQFEADRQFRDTLENLLDEEQMKKFRQSRRR